MLLYYPGSLLEKGLREGDILATQKKADKLAKSTMKISGKVYIPLTAFTKKNDEIAISPQLNLSNYPFKEGQDNYAGVVYSKYDVILKYTGSEIILYKQTGSPSDQKRTSIGSYASVKKSGDYYIVTLKNLPLTGDCFDANDEMTTIKTNKKFILNSGFTVFSTTSKEWKGTVMVDNIQLKTASMTQKITFDKKDYQGFYVSNWASGGDTKASVAKI